MRSFKKSSLFFILIVGLFAANSLFAAEKWPPVLGQAYPDLELVDQNGDKVRLSSFKGSVIVVETVGMTCSACQAFSGAHKKGAFGKIEPQGGLGAIEEYFPQYAGGAALGRDVVFIQILLYNMSMGPTTAEDAKKWAQHFGFDRSKNHIVLAGSKDLMGQASYDMIPGFQLIDKHFILRSDSTGHRPRHDLFRELLPQVRPLLAEN